MLNFLAVVRVITAAGSHTGQITTVFRNSVVNEVFCWPNESVLIEPVHHDKQYFPAVRPNSSDP
jgi:hypothetical protein